MFGFGSKKRTIPFAKLFQVVTPKDFVILFNSELAQTMAFILSFSPKKNFVKKVIHLLDSREAYEDPMHKSSFIIREYLNRCQEDIFNLAFVQPVEKEAESMIAGYESFHDLRNLRKRLYLKHPKEVQITLRAEKEALENNGINF
jgi:hypothetical protein